jgi:arsenate reductase-like glutaredoxin family protein
LYEKEYLSKDEFESIMNASADQVDGIVEAMSTAYRKELAQLEGTSV